MSIHNFTEVKEEDFSDCSFTRDRFGKLHRLTTEEASSGYERVSKKMAIIMMATAISGVFHGFAYASSTSIRKGTDLHVESGGFDDLLSRKNSRDSEDKFGLAVDESTTIGFNENGDPSLAMQF